MADNWDTTPGRTGRRTISQIMVKNDGNGGTTGGTGSDGDGNGNTANVKTSTKKKVEPNYTKTYKKYTIPVPKERYIEPEAYSLARVGLELYETDEDSYVPYVPTNNEVGTTTVEDDEIDNDDDENLVGFNLHLGKIRKTHYHGDCNSISFDSNYKDMSDTGSLKVKDINLTNSYKGVRVKLVSEWEKSGETLKWDDLKQCLLGFITEQSFSDSETEIGLSGMTKTLEMKYKFDFQQMLRSEIINQVILTAGLKPCINVDGLEDDITDFTNVSEGSDDEGGSGESTGSATIDEAVEKAIKGKTGCLAKAKAIDKAFKSHVIYQLYYNVKYPNLDDAWKSANLNCADGANILCAMFRKAGITATILHVSPAHSKGYGHYIVKVTCDGKTYYTDNAANSGSHTTRPFGEVFGDPIGTEVGAKIS